jgi:hypothetical protein
MLVAEALRPGSASKSAIEVEIPIARQEKTSDIAQYTFSLFSIVGKVTAPGMDGVMQCSASCNRVPSLSAPQQLPALR